MASSPAWRKANPDKVVEQRRRYYDQSRADAAASGLGWTERETDRVMAKKIPDRQLAEDLGRSILAIQIHRSRNRGLSGNRRATGEEQCS